MLQEMQKKKTKNTMRNLNMYICLPRVEHIFNIGWSVTTFLNVIILITLQKNHMFDHFYQ